LRLLSTQRFAVLGAEHCAGNDARQVERAQRAQFASGRQAQKRSKSNDHDCHHGKIARQMPELGYHDYALHPTGEWPQTRNLVAAGLLLVKGMASLQHECVRKCSAVVAPTRVTV
jgi:hypothetical protein